MASVPVPHSIEDILRHSSEYFSSHTQVGSVVGILPLHHPWADKNFNVNWFCGSTVLITLPPDSLDSLTEPKMSVCTKMRLSFWKDAAANFIAQGHIRGITHVNSKYVIYSPDPQLDFNLIRASVIENLGVTPAHLPVFEFRSGVDLRYDDLLHTLIEDLNDPMVDGVFIRDHNVLLENGNTPTLCNLFLERLVQFQDFSNGTGKRTAPVLMTVGSTVWTKAGDPKTVAKKVSILMINQIVGSGLFGPNEPTYFVEGLIATPCSLEIGRFRETMYNSETQQFKFNRR